MTAHVFGDDDADLALVQDRNVAVLGYDDQARAQALCLRDSGVDVRVGLDPGSVLEEAALDDGLRVVSPFEACEEADLFVLADVTPDDPVLAEVVLPNLVATDAIVLGAGGALGVDPPAGVDVVRIVAWADGDSVRMHYDQGRGVPMFASVVVDASGAAWDLALAYARAVGGTRAGVLRAADEDLGRARLAGETLCQAGVLPLVRRALDALAESGCPPEVAYVHCVQGLESFAAALADGHLDPDLTRAATAGSTDAGEDSLVGAAALVRALMGRKSAAASGLD